MISLNESVYLSAADPALEAFLDADAFDRSLLLNVLFQPRVILPDNFFYSSKLIERHVLGTPSKSLLEAGIASGIVVPVFRDRASSNFMDDLAAVRKQEVRGMLESSALVARRVQFAADSYGNFTPHYWPQHSVGTKFAALVQQSLMQDDPPPTAKDSIAKLDAMWKDTRTWRTEGINVAIEATRALAGGGLRKGEIWGAVAKAIGIKDTTSINQPSDLLSFGSPSPKEREALEVFCRWVCALYHRNQATEFGATTSFPDFDPITGAIVSYLVPAVTIDGSSSVLGGSVELIIQESVPMPSASSLRSLSPSRLIEVRNDFGPAYFTALSTWQSDPSQGNELEVRRALLQYAKALTKSVSDEQGFSGGLAEVFLRANSAQTRTIVVSLITVALSVASIAEPWLAPLVALAPAGYAIYQWRSTRAKPATITVKASKPTYMSHAELSIAPS